MSEGPTESKRINMKYLSLFVLIIQNTSLVLFLRYSRTMEGPRYLSSTAVVLAEMLKLVTCLVLVLYNNSWNVEKTLGILRSEVVDKYLETLKMSVPSFLYAIQNNLLFLALSNLDAATFQVSYQMKIFTTAVFSVVLLRKKISVVQWVAVGLLGVAVALVQWPSAAPSSVVKITASMRLVGLTAVALACISSGFSGVYFEKMLKGSDTSLWIRNIQLGILGLIFSLIGVYTKDLAAVTKGGFFQGYNFIVVMVIILQALGGLVVANVIKYADNILKGFATAISIVISSLLSYFVLQDFYPNIIFVIGTALVISSTFLYGRPSIMVIKRSNGGEEGIPEK